MHKDLISGKSDEEMRMKHIWSCFESGRNTRNKSASFRTFRIFPLFKLWIIVSPKIFKQILVDLFEKTTKDH